MMAVMLNIVQFAWWTVRRDKTVQSHCQRYGPVYVLVVAAILVNVQPMCMLVIGSWKLKNFFFDGGDFGAACAVGTDCGAGSCLSGRFTCDEMTGICAPAACGVGDLCTCALNSNALVPNTSTGWMIQICGTYLGFVLLFIGVVKATKLHTKMKKKWSDIRGQMQATKLRAKAVDEEEAECTT